MPNEAILGAALADAPIVGEAQEEARLAAFFLTIPGLPGASVLESGIAIGILERHGTVREIIEYKDPAWGPEVDPQFFLRVYWLDRARALITYGIRDGAGRTFLWKAGFSADDGVLEAAHVGVLQGQPPISPAEARELWFDGLGAPTQ